MKFETLINILLRESDNILNGSEIVDDASLIGNDYRKADILLGNLYPFELQKLEQVVLMLSEKTQTVETGKKAFWMSVYHRIVQFKN